MRKNITRTTLLAFALCMGVGTSESRAQKISPPVISRPVERVQNDSSASDLDLEADDLSRPRRGTSSGTTPESARALLDVQLRPGADRGVMVTAIRPQGAADRAGIEKDDVLLTIEGRSVSRPDQVSALLRTKAPGEQVTVTLLRNGEEQTKQVQLSSGPASTTDSRQRVERRRPAELSRQNQRSRPDESTDDTLAPVRQDDDRFVKLDEGWLGVAVEAGGEDINGLRITRVFPGGPAARAGIRKDSVLLAIEGQPLKEHADLGRALKGTHPGQTVTVVVTHGAAPQLHKEQKTIRLGDRKLSRQRTIDEQDPSRDSPDYWEDSQGFAAQIPSQSFELEYQRRTAEQNERLERLLIKLSAEVQSLREEVTALKQAN